MDSGGNENLNKFLSKYEISKDMDIVSKYNTNVASVYGDKIQALAEVKTLKSEIVLLPPSISNFRHEGSLSMAPASYRHQTPPSAVAVMVTSCSGPH
ncbi:hypothetical protein E3N88_28860 [Mikania micrantha]|uniref:Uncharacterized protein n=1 Tax=Mikania micrantha TaxID=192012 RepID=A0A5N6N0Q2_9ASTR|nr:hypothetical protein E3N88_28860 [Mikania micrantha]